MSALHWICALTLALVCCLSAQPVKRDADNQKYLVELIGNLRDVIANRACENDTELYSPTNVHEDCLSSARNCTIDELDALQNECSFEPDDLELIESIKLGLEREKWNITRRSSKCRKCEGFDTTDAAQFVNNMMTLVQRLNALSNN